MKRYFPDSPEICRKAASDSEIRLAGRPACAFDRLEKNLSKIGKNEYDSLKMRLKLMMVYDIIV